MAGVFPRADVILVFLADLANTWDIVAGVIGGGK
jgi:hypothetical protein